MPVFSPSEHRKVLDSPDFLIARGPKDAHALLQKLESLVEEGGALGVDTETTGLDPRADQVRLIQVASATSALLVDLDGWRRPGERLVDWEEWPGLKELRALLEGPRPKVLQNAAFDLGFLRGEGVDLGGLLFDTMVAAKLINNGTGNKNDLGSITKRQLSVELPKELQKADWSGELSAEQLEYAARDAIVLPRLAEQLRQGLASTEVQGEPMTQIFELEMSCLKPIALMQWHGFGFDAAGAAQLLQKLEQEAQVKMRAMLEHLDEAIRLKNPEDSSTWLPRNEDGSFNTNARDSGSIRLGTKVYAGFNPRSDQQMALRLQQAGVILRPNDKGKPSMDQNLLAFIKGEFPLVAEYLAWNKQMTLISHVEKLLNSIGPDGRIHGSYRQMGTDTGRLSAASPNLQQIPRSGEFRRLFRAAEGYRLVVADFSQVELRVAAQLSGEERMIEAYRAGRDLHTETAALITGKQFEDVTKEERTSAKISNFGLLYGAGAATLQKQAVAQYGVDLSFAEAKELVTGFREAYPTLKKWQDKEGNKTTKAVTTRIGRRRILTGFNDKYTTRINTQVQGTAGDIAKTAIALLWQQLERTPEDEARLISMVHDEIVMEVRADHVDLWQKRLSCAMEDAGNSICSDVPIVAEASSGETWADAK
jgi:DNA polymerase I-like protein with 3'-5' exonuclease and polymerase domains